MKRKYITTQILLACLAKPAPVRKDIHAQLKETIAERKKIMEQLTQADMGVYVRYMVQFELKAA